METKADNPITLLDGTQMPGIVQAYFEFNQLKQLYRQGWLRRGLERERCESVAEHSLGVAILALWLVEAYRPGLDAGKVLRMALLHDFGEIYAGDIIPDDDDSIPDDDDSIPDEGSTSNKSALERDSVLKVFGRLPDGQDYIHLWEEFEAGETAEARFVHQIDRLEMGFQASVYQAQGLGRMDEFLESARLALTDPELIAILDELAELSH